MSTTPSVLVISFSPLLKDARVLRQINALRKVARVSTVGYGDPPPGVETHFEIPKSSASLPQTVRGVALLAFRQFRRAELQAPASLAAMKSLKGHEFDMVVANDARSIPLAFAVKGSSPVWADLHEWAPEERTHVRSWRLLVSPFMDHICHTYLPKCDAVTTVGEAIADLYAERYRVKPELVRNAAPFADLTPSKPLEDGSIRLAHSGAAIFGREFEKTIDAVMSANDNITLDLYLVPGGDGGIYLDALKSRAATCDRITFHPPVPPAQLPQTLNQYDVGVFWIPPFNTNARLTLPNKLFDFVQARLAVAVGPSLEMARLVNDFDLGVVTQDYEITNIVSALNSLSTHDITRFKSAADKAARVLNFENEAQTIEGIVKRLTMSTRSR